MNVVRSVTWFATVILVGASSCLAQDVTGQQKFTQQAIVDGEILYSHCQYWPSYQSEHALDVAWCGAYINGVFDTHGVFDYYGQERKFCNPVGISLQELTDIVVPYLRNHPNERNKVGAYLVEAALKERFPCN